MSESGKAKYKEMYIVDRERYQREFQEWKREKKIMALSQANGRKVQNKRDDRARSLMVKEPNETKKIDCEELSFASDQKSSILQSGKTVIDRFCINNKCVYKKAKNFSREMIADISPAIHIATDIKAETKKTAKNKKSIHNQVHTDHNISKNCSKVRRNHKDKSFNKQFCKQPIMGETGACCVSSQTYYNPVAFNENSLAKSALCEFLVIPQFKFASQESLEKEIESIMGAEMIRKMRALNT